jgi:hypothetical protein
MNEWMNWIAKESAVRFMSISLEHSSFGILEKKQKKEEEDDVKERNTTGINWVSINWKKPPVSLLLEPTTICLHAVHTGFVLK